MLKSATISSWSNAVAMGDRPPPGAGCACADGCTVSIMETVVRHVRTLVKSSMYVRSFFRTDAEQLHFAKGSKSSSILIFARQRNSESIIAEER